MKIYISGGCKNGKTSFAQNAALKLAGAASPDCLRAAAAGQNPEGPGRRRIYVATMIPGDSEDLDRIQKHLENRAGLGFDTAEKSSNISELLKTEGSGCVYLVDSITALVQNAMFPGTSGSNEEAKSGESSWGVDNKDGNGEKSLSGAAFKVDRAASAPQEPEFGSPEHIKKMRLAALDLKEDLLKFIEAAEDAVFVSDFIFSEAARYDQLTIEYMKALADIDRSLSARCECVIELCAGNVIYHKGNLKPGEI